MNDDRRSVRFGSAAPVVVAIAMMLALAPDVAEVSDQRVFSHDASSERPLSGLDLEQPGSSSDGIVQSIMMIPTSMRVEPEMHKQKHLSCGKVVRDYEGNTR